MRSMSGGNTSDYTERMSKWNKIKVQEDEENVVEDAKGYVHDVSVWRDYISVGQCV